MGFVLFGGESGGFFACWGILRFPFYQTACPVDLDNKDEGDDAFDDFASLREDEERLDCHIGESGKRINDRDGNRPHESRVEKDGDEDFTTCTEGEIGGVAECHDRGKDTEGDKHELGEGVDGIGDTE